MQQLPGSVMLCIMCMHGALNVLGHVICGSPAGALMDIGSGLPAAHYRKGAPEAGAHYCRAARWGHEPAGARPGMPSLGGKLRFAVLIAFDLLRRCKLWMAVTSQCSTPCRAGMCCKSQYAPCRSTFALFCKTDIPTSGLSCELNM